MAIEPDAGTVILKLLEVARKILIGEQDPAPVAQALELLNSNPPAAGETLPAELVAAEPPTDQSPAGDQIRFVATQYGYFGLNAQGFIVMPGADPEYGDVQKTICAWTRYLLAKTPDGLRAEERIGDLPQATKFGQFLFDSGAREARPAVARVVAQLVQELGGFKIAEFDAERARFVLER